MNRNEYNILNTITRKNGLLTIGYKRFYCNVNIYFDTINDEPQLNDFIEYDENITNNYILNKTDMIARNILKQK